ncbi:hypothetical protein L1987_84338 [Smallanthus sonchifolius]|uniref:Uncharacterized protein n=1 Tax=Smallanthus sonchifolius TaxID=185202 RepID=A0ACB8YF30_9ASTR|nr:hypothetical protein L1987_84338 [Smallanthus sonchifolius]
MVESGSLTLQWPGPDCIYYPILKLYIKFGLFSRTHYFSLHSLNGSPPIISAGGRMAPIGPPSVSGRIPFAIHHHSTPLLKQHLVVCHTSFPFR